MSFASLQRNKRSSWMETINKVWRGAAIRSVAGPVSRDKPVLYRKVPCQDLVAGPLFVSLSFSICAGTSNSMPPSRWLHGGGDTRQWPQGDRCCSTTAAASVTTTALSLESAYARGLSERKLAKDARGTWKLKPTKADVNPPPPPKKRKSNSAAVLAFLNVTPLLGKTFCSMSKSEGEPEK